LAFVGSEIGMAVDSSVLGAAEVGILAALLALLDMTVGSAVGLAGALVGVVVVTAVVVAAESFVVAVAAAFGRVGVIVEPLGLVVVAVDETASFGGQAVVDVGTGIVAAAAAAEG
jgi:hypothetical protein